MGTIKNVKIKLKMKANAEPKFFRARNVPYALREKVKENLDQLEKEGIITKVESSEWVFPIVVVPKENGEIRLCGDY